MHKYDHHIGDYTRDTVGLAMIEDGAYRRLLDQCYASELPLPSERGELYRMARAATSAERKAVDYVLGRYFVLRSDGWHQNRADLEIGEFHGKSGKAKAAADRRWEEHRLKHANGYAPADANAYADASKTQGIGNASRERAGAGDRPPSSVLHPPAVQKHSAIAPPGVLQDTWDAWLRSKGKKQTADADRLQRKHLAEWAAQGHDPNAIVEHSIASRYTGLFPPKGNAQQRGPPSARDQRTANIDRLTGQDRTQRNERFAGTAERVDRKAVPEIPSDLREPPDDDVR